MEREGTVRIGQAAAASGVSIDAIRYYERLGLLAPAPRTRGGFRMYSQAQIEQLRAIRRAQAMGLTLREVHEVVHGQGRPARSHCDAVRQILDRRVRDIDARLEELQRLRCLLMRARERCDDTLREPDVTACPVAAELGHMPIPS